MNNGTALEHYALGTSEHGRVNVWFWQQPDIAVLYGEAPNDAEAEAMITEAIDEALAYDLAAERDGLTLDMKQIAEQYGINIPRLMQLVNIRRGEFAEDNIEYTLDDMRISVRAYIRAGNYLEAAPEEFDMRLMISWCVQQLQAFTS